MNYTAIGQDKKEDEKSFFTIGDLLSLAKVYKGKVFRFVDTDFFPSKLSSWRGSYDTPQIEYSREAITGRELEKLLVDGLKATHYGYKGGEYEYYEDDQFYVSSYGKADEYAVFGYELNNQNEVVLLTDINEY